MCRYSAELCSKVCGEPACMPKQNTCTTVYELTALNRDVNVLRGTYISVKHNINTAAGYNICGCIPISGLLISLTGSLLW